METHDQRMERLRALQHTSTHLLATLRKRQMVRAQLQPTWDYPVIALVAVGKHEQAVTLGEAA